MSPGLTAANAGAATGTFAALRYPSFTYLWLGNLCSSGATWVQQVAINWLVYDLTNSAAMLGLVQAFRTAPWAVTAPFQGVIVDRYNRRTIVMVSQAFLTVVTAAFTLTVALGAVEVWHVLLFTFLMGCGTAINNTTRRAIVPSLVPRATLVNAAAMGNIPMNIMRTLGPAIGGVLIQFVGMLVNFFVQVGLYAASFGTSLFVRPSAGEVETGRERAPYARALRESLDYIRRDRAVMAVMALGMVACLFMFPIQSLIPVFARDIYHLGADGYGVLLMATGVGSIAGTLGLASLRQLDRKAPLLFVLMSLAIGMPLVFAWVDAVPIALVVLALQGAGQMAFFSLKDAMVQLLVPSSMLGRAMAVDNVSAGLIPLGGMVAGYLADALDARLALTLVNGCGLVLVMVVFAALPSVRRL